MAKRFQAELEVQATEISKLSHDERPERLDEIEAALLTARYQEEVLIGAALARGEDITRDADTKPEAVLGIKPRAQPPSSASRAA